MGRLLKSLVLATSVFAASTVFAAESEKKPETKTRFNPSISYGKNISLPNGALENYNPVRIRFGIEKERIDSWFSNKYTVTPFFGRVQGSYDMGIDFGLKKIFLEGGGIKPFIHYGLGGIYLDKKLKEHRRKWNFHLNFESGLELEGFTFTLGYSHASAGDKIVNNFKKYILGGATKDDNEGNPGMEEKYFSLGMTFSW